MVVFFAQVSYIDEAFGSKEAHMMKALFSGSLPKVGMSRIYSL